MTRPHRCVNDGSTPLTEHEKEELTMDFGLCPCDWYVLTVLTKEEWEGLDEV